MTKTHRLVVTANAAGFVTEREAGTIDRRTTVLSTTFTTGFPFHLVATVADAPHYAVIIRAAK
jgi:hypothetical protein